MLYYSTQKQQSQQERTLCKAMGNNTCSKSSSHHKQLSLLIKSIIDRCVQLNVITSCNNFVNYQNDLIQIQQLNNSFNNHLINNPLNYSIIKDNDNNNYSRHTLKQYFIDSEINGIILPYELINIVIDYMLSNDYILVRITPTDNPCKNTNFVCNLITNRIYENKSIDNDYYTNLIQPNLITTIVYAPIMHTNRKNRYIGYYEVTLFNNPDRRILLRITKPVKDVNNSLRPIVSYTIINDDHIVIYTGFSIEIYAICKEAIKDNNMTHEIIYSKLTLLAPTCPYFAGRIQQLVYNNSNNTLILIVLNYICVYNIFNGQLINFVTMKIDCIYIRGNCMLIHDNNLLLLFDNKYDKLCIQVVNNLELLTIIMIMAMMVK